MTHIVILVETDPQAGEARFTAWKVDENSRPYVRIDEGPFEQGQQHGVTGFATAESVTTFPAIYGHDFVDHDAHAGEEEEAEVEEPESEAAPAEEPEADEPAADDKPAA